MCQTGIKLDYQKLITVLSALDMIRATTNVITTVTKVSKEANADDIQEAAFFDDHSLSVLALCVTEGLYGYVGFLGSLWHLSNMAFCTPWSIEGAPDARQNNPKILAWQVLRDCLFGTFMFRLWSFGFSIAAFHFLLKAKLEEDFNDLFIGAVLSALSLLFASLKNANPNQWVFDAWSKVKLPRLGIHGGGSCNSDCCSSQCYRFSLECCCAPSWGRPDLHRGQFWDRCFDFFRPNYFKLNFFEGLRFAGIYLAALLSLFKGFGAFEVAFPMIELSSLAIDFSFLSQMFCCTRSHRHRDTGSCSLSCVLPFFNTSQNCCGLPHVNLPSPQVAAQGCGRLTIHLLTMIIKLMALCFVYFDPKLPGISKPHFGFGVGLCMAAVSMLLNRGIVGKSMDYVDQMQMYL